ncbi:MAG: hypothetical protein EOO75_06130 [Myxococcales bacterium]|nr:MAG: hypothetical protein EOO75_06130 [Myxococcales bacterium]
MGAVLLPAACADQDATALTVAISSEAQIPAELDSVSLKITRGNSVRFAQTYVVDPATRTAQLPGTITIQPREDENLDDPVKVEISGNARKKQVVLRTARVGFVEEKQKLLRMTLRYSCVDLPSGCADPDQTCIGGRCVDNAIEARGLPEFISVEATFPKGKEGCFDLSEASACLAQRTAVKLPGDLVTEVSPGQFTCRFTPAPASAGGTVDAGTLNVFALWKNQADQKLPHVLESQSPEGWRTASTSPLVVELADGLCDAVRDGRISLLSYSTGPCAAKIEDTPLCQPTEPLVGKAFFESDCHRCAYFKETAAGTPGECQTFYDAALANTGSAEQAITQQVAASCLYDGTYSGPEECALVGGCFFQNMTPFLDCQASCVGATEPCTTCADYPNLLKWSQCLEGWKPLDGSGGSCAAVCGSSQENAVICQ